MVYQDYDDEGIEEGPVTVGEVSGEKKARASTRLLHRKVCGVPVVFLAGLLLVVSIVGIAIVALGGNGSDDDNNAFPQPPPATTETPAPTPAATTLPYDAYDKRVEWVQKGNDLLGVDTAKGNFGITVGISGDGHKFAEGTHQAIGHSASTGHVRVFTYDQIAKQWTQFGPEILGEKVGDEFGAAIDLSRTGDHIAVGAPGADRHTGEDNGYVKVFTWNATIDDWQQLGEAKWGEHHYEYAGRDVQISSNGEVLVAGAPGNDKLGPNTGEVRVYQYMAKTDRWLRRGQDLHGENAGDMFGWSVAMSDDGVFMAGGSPYNDDNGEDAGSVRLFHYDHDQSNRYHKVAYTLTGKNPGDNFGFSVAMDGLGATIAVGAPAGAFNGLPNAGYVEVFSWNAQVGLHKLGKPIYGRTAYEGFGKSVKLSMDGRTLIVGSPDHNKSTGIIRVFKYDEATLEWLLVGNEIEGDGESDFWGGEVALSSDGNTIISGGTNMMGLEVGNTHVRAYEAA
jgi:hypothetical protein